MGGRSLVVVVPAGDRVFPFTLQGGNGNGESSICWLRGQK